jgi:transposase
LYFGRRAGTLRAMPRKRHHKPVLLTEDERRTLEQWARRPKTAQRLALRSRMVLACAEGLPNRTVAKRLQVSSNSVCKWRERFRVRRLPGLTDEPRPGAPRKATDDRIVDVITRTLEGPPAQAATQWTTRSLADVAGLSKSTISRIWQTFGLQSHRLDTFKLSADPQFVEKVRDIVGLYLCPPARAIVLSVDEKGQVQALDRTRPLLPMRPGIPARRTHDYIRHGTTSLFAALDVATGKVIGQCHRRQRHQEFLKFLERVDAQLPPDREVHVIMDNYGTHKAPKHYWPGSDPLGKRFRLNGRGGPWVEIVGLVKTSKYSFLIESPTEFVYFPYRQRPQPRMALVAESMGDPSRLAAPLQEVVRSLDASQPIYNLRTLEEHYRMRVITVLNVVVRLIGAMGIMGLALAIVGLYALVARAASRRTKEIGIRMAIGAGRSDVLRMVLRQGMVLAVAGLAVGLLVSLGANRALATVFPRGAGDSGRTDLVAFVLVASVVLAVTLLAAYVPASRASRINPTEALRCE